MRSVVEWIIIAKEMETQSVVEETIPTKKLYDEDAYCREFRARVLSCKRLPDGSRNLIMDQSAFFPEAGGQSCDTGWVWQEGASPLRVSQVRLQDGILIHTVVEQADPGHEGEVAPGHEEQVAPWHEKQAAPGHEGRNRSHPITKDRCSRRVRKSLPNWTLRLAMTRCSSIRENIFFPVW